jgi:hypothetical protein
MNKSPGTDQIEAELITKGNVLSKKQKHNNSVRIRKKSQTAEGILLYHL